MSEVINTDLDRLAKSEFSRISLGLKPSGLIHLGTALTFLNGVIALTGNRNATLDAAVMDLDFDFQRGADFISFQVNPDAQSCHSLMKEHTEMEARETLAEIAE